MSPWLEGIFLVGGMVLLAIAGTMLTRRWVGAETLRNNNEVAGFIYAVIGVTYAVLIGLTAIIVWEQYDKARAVVEQEANELADLYRDAQPFPEAVRKEIEARIGAYARVVVEKEWPAMERRASSPEAWEAYDQLWRVHYQFRPENEHQMAWYRESLKNLNELGDHRRLRLLSSRTQGVPPVMWVVLIGAGIVTIGYSFLFGTRSAIAHILMTGGVAIVIALVLLGVLAMDHPFSGITRVQPEAFEQTLEIIGGGNPGR
jgi:hypothetical protein